MKHTTPQQFSFEILFNPAVAKAAVERAAKWDLPRHICRPLDQYAGRRVDADLAAYDAEVDLQAFPAEEIKFVASDGDSADEDTHFEGADQA